MWHSYGTRFCCIIFIFWLIVMCLPLTLKAVQHNPRDEQGFKNGCMVGIAGRVTLAVESAARRWRSKCSPEMKEQEQTKFIPNPEPLLLPQPVVAKKSLLRVFLSHQFLSSPVLWGGGWRRLQKRKVGQLQLEDPVLGDWIHSWLETTRNWQRNSRKSKPVIPTYCMLCPSWFLTKRTITFSMRTILDNAASARRASHMGSNSVIWDTNTLIVADMLLTRSGAIFVVHLPFVLPAKASLIVSVELWQKKMELLVLGAFRGPKRALPTVWNPMIFLLSGIQWSFWRALAWRTALHWRFCLLIFLADNFRSICMILIRVLICSIYLSLPASQKVSRQ